MENHTQREGNVLYLSLMISVLFWSLVVFLCFACQTFVFFIIYFIYLLFIYFAFHALKLQPITLVKSIKIPAHYCTQNQTKVALAFSTLGLKTLLVCQ